MPIEIQINGDNIAGIGMVCSAITYNLYWRNATFFSFRKRLPRRNWPKCIRAQAIFLATSVDWIKHSGTAYRYNSGIFAVSLWFKLITPNIIGNALRQKRGLKKNTATQRTGIIPKSSLCFAVSLCLINTAIQKRKCLYYKSTDRIKKEIIDIIQSLFVKASNASCHSYLFSLGYKWQSTRLQFPPFWINIEANNILWKD